MRTSSSKSASAGGGTGRLKLKGIAAMNGGGNGIVNGTGGAVGIGGASVTIASSMKSNIGSGGGSGDRKKASSPGVGGDVEGAASAGCFALSGEVCAQPAAPQENAAAKKAATKGLVVIFIGRLLVMRPSILF